MFPHPYGNVAELGTASHRVGQQKRGCLHREGLFRQQRQPLNIPSDMVHRAIGGEDG